MNRWQVGHEGSESSIPALIELAASDVRYHVNRLQKGDPELCSLAHGLGAQIYPFEIYTNNCLLGVDLPLWTLWRLSNIYVDY